MANTGRFFTAEGHFTAPALIENIGELPPEFRPMYEESTRLPGKYQLTEEGKELHAWFLAEVAQLEAERTRVTSEGDAQLATLRKQGVDAAVATALTDALSAAGVKAGLLGAAAALIRDENKFEVEPSDDGTGNVVLAMTKAGFLQSVEGVVEAFVSAPESAEFLGKTAAPASAYFSDMLKGLKQRR